MTDRNHNLFDRVMLKEDGYPGHGTIVESEGDDYHGAWWNILWDAQPDEGERTSWLASALDHDLILVEAHAESCPAASNTICPR